MKKIVILLVILLVLTGCTIPFLKITYNKELASIFPRQKEEVKYSGLSGYNHTLTYNKKRESNSKISFYYKGILTDDLTSENDRTFNVRYIVDDEKVVEEFYDNTDTYLENSSFDTLNSIIPNQIILKLPLEINNTWTQKFFYNGKSLEAETTIIDIYNIDEEIKQYKTETIVNGIEGYFEDRYKEIKTYGTNKGLISFQNTSKEKNVNLSKEPTENDFLFGYARK